MAQVIQATEGKLALLSGDDNLIVPVLSIGGVGVISVISMSLSKETGDITRDYFAGRQADAQKNFLKLLPAVQSDVYRNQSNSGEIRRGAQGHL